MKRLYTVLVLLVAGHGAIAQENDFTQYYLNLPSVNAGFTGMNEYMDVRTGVREGWNSFGIKNNNVYFSAYTALGKANRSGRRNNSFRTSNPAVFEQVQADKNFRRRIGLGGMVTQRTVGPYRAITGSVNFAYHLPLSNKLSVSLGSKVGLMNQRIDFTGLTVRDDVNDIFYQNLVAANQGTQNTVAVDFGALLYSNRFYLGVSTANLITERLNGEFLFDLQDGIRYRFQTGAFFPVSSEWSLSPAITGVLAEGYDLRWSGTLRMRYKDLLVLGGGVEPGSHVSVLLGASAKNLSIGYSYDIYTSSLNNFNANTHEVVLGISLFNRYNLAPRFW